MKKLISLLLAVIMVVSLAACQKKEETKEVTLNIWLNSLMPASDELLAEEDWYINQAIKRYQETHPNVKFEITKLGDGNETATLFKAAAAAGSAPDICEFWTGEWMFDVEDYTLDFYDKLSDKTKNDVLGWDTVCRDYNTSNKKIGIPIAVQTIAGIYYNRDIIKAAGLDFDANPPKTTDELLDACEKIKAAGYTPFLADEGERHEMFYYIGNYWWKQQSGAQTIVAENKGEAKYVDDQGLRNVLDFYQVLIDNEYINPDCLSASDDRARFMEGKEGAMTGGSSSRMSSYSEALGDKLGFMRPGDMDPNGVIQNGLLGGAGQGLIISKDTKYAQECIDFVEFLVSPEEFKHYREHEPAVIPNLNSITAADMPDAPDVTKQALGYKQDVTFYADNMVDSDVMNEVFRLSANLINHTMTTDDVLAALDEVIALKK